MSKIALTNGQYADLVIAADTNVGGMYPLPNGQYAQTVVPVDADGNVITGSAGGGNAFTYDQQVVPSSPIRGQTWRERDSNNDIFGNWFWNGTYWVSPEYLLSSLTNSFLPTSGTTLTAACFGTGQSLLVGKIVVTASFYTEEVVNFIASYTSGMIVYQDFYSGNYSYSSGIQVFKFYPNIVIPATQQFRIVESSSTTSSSIETINFYGRYIRD